MAKKDDPGNLSPNKTQPGRGMKKFVNAFEDKYPKAVRYLTKDY
jgi:hypothetical protein